MLPQPSSSWLSTELSERQPLGYGNMMICFLDNHGALTVF